VDFDFFEENVSISYAEDFSLVLSVFFTTENVAQFYYDIEDDYVTPSLNDLMEYKTNMHLSDWYYYLLIRETAQQLFPDNSQPYFKSYQTVFAWLMLARSGYKVQLNYTETDVYLSVFTLDKLYDIPVKKHGQGWMVEVSQFHTNHKGFVATVRSNFFLSENKHLFTFKPKQLPLFTNPILTERIVKFEHEEKEYFLNCLLDRTMLQLINTLPEMGVVDHVKMPLSQNTYNSLIPALTAHIRGMNKEEAIRFLLSFTRTGFEYQDDQVYSHDNITFTPEETLYYRYSDCEDRSVLFAYLVRELLEIETILLDFDTHVAVGINLGDNHYVGKPIFHNGIFYTYCEPTGPDNSLGVGEYPDGLREETYVVLE